MGAGRPSGYSYELVTELCKRIATSERGIARICKEDDDMPHFATVYDWLANPKYSEFVELYARAKDMQLEWMRDQLVIIADDSSGDVTINEYGVQENREFTSRSRLRIDTRKWLMAKLNPKKYGDKIDVTSDGKAINQSVVVPTKSTADDVNNLDG